MPNTAIQGIQWLKSVTPVVHDLDVYFEDSSSAIEALQAQEAVPVTAWVSTPEARFPQAVVYTVPDGRLFCVPLDESTGNILADEAVQLTSPSFALLSSSRRMHIAFEDLGEAGAPASSDIQKWLEAAYRGPAQTR